MDSQLRILGSIERFAPRPGNAVDVSDRTIVALEKATLSLGNFSNTPPSTSAASAGVQFITRPSTWVLKKVIETVGQLSVAIGMAEQRMPDSSAWQDG